MAGTRPPTAGPIGTRNEQTYRMTKFWRQLSLLIFAAFALFPNANGQVKRELSLGKGSLIEVVNRYGKVDVTAVKSAEGETVKPELTATAKLAMASDEIIGT